MIPENQIREDVYGNKWVYVPSWLDSIINLRISEVYNGYLIELRYNPALITQSRFIHRQMKNVKLGILSAFFDGTVTKAHYQEWYPYAPLREDIVKVWF